MERVLLCLRLLVGAVVGLICMIAFPQRLTFVILGYLGMPRRYHPTELQHFYFASKFVDFLWMMFVLLLGVLCFKDVFKTTRKLRASYDES